MKPLLFSFNGANNLVEGLLRNARMEVGELELRQFPDGESYVRLVTPAEHRDVVLLCSLDRPDAKTIPLLLAADAARAQGARSVGLVAPYLAYMRQDRMFKPGEAVSSVTFARLLSQQFDWLVTVDPHLHRYPCLDTIYSIPAIAASAAAPIARWIRSNIGQPFLIGPDTESRQWVEQIARLAKAPSTVFAKTRSGDFEVSIEDTEAPIPPRATPVIVDDIASSARTLIEAIHVLKARGHPAPVCIVLHPLFAGDAYQQLVEAGPARIISTNTVQHLSNGIDISGPVTSAIKKILDARRSANSAEPIRTSM